MSTSPKNRNCLDLEEISKYVNGKLSANHSHSVEHHLLDCELCSDAVEGYREQPFTANDIPAFEGLSKPTVAPISWTRWIGVAAVVLIGTSIGIFMQTQNKDSMSADNLSTSPGAQLDSMSTVLLSAEVLTSDKNERLNELIEQDREVKELITKPIKDRNDLAVFGKKDESIWMMPQKNQELVGGLVDVPVTSSFRNSNKDTFIFDLKVTGFNELYAFSEETVTDKTTATEARFENKEKTGGDGKEADLEKLTTKDVFVKAMDNFSKNNFTNALKLFNILISYEPEDVNSLFYAAICYKNLNRAEDAISYLDRVLANSVTTFNQEAEWEKAQAYIQLKDFKKAEVLLDKICQEKGFYTERATDLLKRVKVKTKTK